MNFIVDPYLAQVARWPKAGNHILGQFDDASIVVYQAFSPYIGNYAISHGYFGGAFSFTRMSWIKPNFLWMMYRSGWGTKEGQEVVLAIRLKRTAFDTILARAIHSRFITTLYRDETAWKTALEHSDVRLQWDPDHDPSGRKLERRAIQLGLRDDTLVEYARHWILEIQDISSFVKEQRQYLQSADYNQLVTPQENVYPVKEGDLAIKLGLSPSENVNLYFSTNRE